LVDLYDISTANCVCFSLVEQGFQEGLQQGNISGYEKGFALGVKHGAEINQEVWLAYFTLYSSNIDTLSMI